MTGSPLTHWGFSTPAMDDIFSADRVVRAMLDFESALALALADAGVAPRAEAEAVAAACEEQLDDPEKLLATTWADGTPLIAVTELIRSRLAGDEREWVHFGTTTQDVVDSAHMLLARTALDLLDQGLLGVAGEMRGQIIEHRDQPHMARTFLQHARPTTFGMRVAGWLEPTLSHIESLRSTRDGLAVQLGGPVGNLAAYGPHGTDVVRALADRLDLRAPNMPWHSDRSRIRLLGNAVDAAVATLAKVADDVALLASSDIAEVRTRSGRSSSMPHKENPIDPLRALAAAEVCRGAVAMVLGRRPPELDRGLGSWHAEWVALPLMFRSAAAVVEATSSSLETLEVDAAAMAARVEDDVELDPALIDAVLDRYERVVGDA